MRDDNAVSTSATNLRNAPVDAQPPTNGEAIGTSLAAARYFRRCPLGEIVALRPSP